MITIKKGFNRKYVFLILIIILCIILIISFFIGMRIKEQKQEEYKKEMEFYEQLKENVNKEVTRYAYKVWPTCNPKMVTQSISDGALIRYAGVKREMFLDYDKENFCDTYTEVYCISENKLEFKTYLRCKKYKDKGFKDRD